MARVLLTCSLKYLTDLISEMTKNKFDCIIFIEGNRGLGKSTLAYKVANGLDVDIPFKPKRDIVYSREDVLRHLATKKKGIIFGDELINVAYNRDFFETDQKTLLKALNMYRDSCNVFIGCVPRFSDLDTQLQRLCKIKITVVRRGLAILHKKVASIYNKDPWDSKNNQKIEEGWSQSRTKHPKYSQLTTAFAFMSFGDLTNSQRDEYESIKDEKRGQVFGSYNDSEMMLDKDGLFIKKVYEKVKAQELTPKDFELLAETNSYNVETLRKKINAKLKEENIEYRWKDLVTTDKKKDKRDKLGFTIDLPSNESPTKNLDEAWSNA